LLVVKGHARYAEALEAPFPQKYSNRWQTGAIHYFQTAPDTYGHPKSKAVVDDICVTHDCREGPREGLSRGTIGANEQDTVDSMTPRSAPSLATKLG
jgi:hypothetical protein